MLYEWMKLRTLAAGAGHDSQFEQYLRPSKPGMFLATTEQIVPWPELCAVTEPHYPMPANGRPPAELERMLRTCLAQLRISPVDEPCGEALMDGTLVQARGLKAGTPVP